MTELARLDDLQRAAEDRIVTVRGQHVILDTDLAEFYEVPTKRLNQQATRNAARFPEDFRFQLTAEELDGLRLQNVTSNTGRGGRRARP
jgi:ORF6N domain-containing protein